MVDVGRDDGAAASDFGADELRLADRCGVEEFRALITFLTQTEEMGGSVARSLRVYAETMRDKRSQAAEEAARKLEAQGVSVALINPRWIKPMDTGTLEFFARSVDVVCTIEDHVLHNGFGCAVMEHLAEAMIKTPVVRVGWPDQFVEHGAVPILQKKHGLTAEAVVEKVLPFVKNSKAAAASISIA